MRGLPLRLGLLGGVPAYLALLCPSVGRSVLEIPFGGEIGLRLLHLPRSNHSYPDPALWILTVSRSDFSSVFGSRLAFRQIVGRLPR